MSNPTTQPDSDPVPFDRQLDILSQLSALFSITDLDELIASIVNASQRLLGSGGCSIYLHPEYVSKYDGVLYENKDGELPIRGSDLPAGSFVVLANSSRASALPLIGKAFYQVDQGLTGWVYRHGIPLRLRDISDQAEVQRQASGARWLDRYDGSPEYYQTNTEFKPILIVPLLARTGTLGVIKFLDKSNRTEFSQADESLAVILAQIISNSLEKTWIIRRQESDIRSLVELGTKRQTKHVFESVTQRMGSMLNSRRCQLYLRDRDIVMVRLVAEQGRTLDPPTTAFKRKEGLIGWVFGSGKPLLIDDIRPLANSIRLSDELLQQISDGPLIDDEDRQLMFVLSPTLQAVNRPIPFMAVPVKSSDGTVLGVLCADCPAGITTPRPQPFDRKDLYMAQAFASMIAFAIANERERKAVDLLTQLGQDWDIERLLDFVMDRLPELVPGTAFSIFRYDQPDQPYLRLVRTNREGLSRGLQPIDLIYKLGDGKTGLAALTRTAIVVNHYGSGAIAQKTLETALEPRHTGVFQEVSQRISNDQGRPVGLFQIRLNRKLPPEHQAQLTDLAKHTIIYDRRGLLSKAVSWIASDAAPSFSFVAIPCVTQTGDLYGVLSGSRSVPRNPFAASEVSLLSSIAAWLASMIHNIKLLEQRETLIMSLAHEINTPMQGIIADSANLADELPAGSELHEIARHNLDQVLQLHLMSETIMAVMTEQTPQREFSMHNIYRPLKDAREMFVREGVAKGCEILEPRAVGDRFPEIEMSLFDLTIAFKNLIHNAVKYSFRPARGQDNLRSVRILGQWADEARTRYAVSIQNFGVGISPEEIANRTIFQSFVRGTKASDRRRTGAGLGLSHARQIVEILHNGRIEVTSRQVAGEAHLTTFTVILPATQPKLKES